VPYSCRHMDRGVVRRFAEEEGRVGRVLFGGGLSEDDLARNCIVLEMVPPTGAPAETRTRRRPGVLLRKLGAKINPLLGPAASS
jgi:hypothetical protein